MKLIRSQDKLILINAQHVSHILIAAEEDDDGDTTGNMDIDVFLGDFHDDSYSRTIATHRTTEECVRSLDKLAAFLSSSNSSGVYEMSQY